MLDKCLVGPNSMDKGKEPAHTTSSYNSFDALCSLPEQNNRKASQSGQISDNCMSLHEKDMADDANQTFRNHLPIFQNLQINVAFPLILLISLKSIPSEVAIGVTYPLIVMLLLLASAILTNLCARNKSRLTLNPLLMHHKKNSVLSTAPSFAYLFSSVSSFHKMLSKS